MKREMRKEKRKENKKKKKNTFTQAFFSFFSPIKEAKVNKTISKIEKNFEA